MKIDEGWRPVVIGNTLRCFGSNNAGSKALADDIILLEVFKQDVVLNKELKLLRTPIEIC